MPRALSTIVADVLGVPESSVIDAMSADTTPAWTSLAHIDLVLALEAEYGIALTAEDGVDMLSVKLIRMILVEKGVGAAIIGSPSQ